MKKLALITALIVSGALYAQDKQMEVAQEAEVIQETAVKQETEVIQETEVKIIKINNGKEITEEKVIVVSREASNIEFNENDKDKINQERVNSSAKVEREVYVDKDANKSYTVLTKEAYYVSDGSNYIFSPNEKGFGINYILENDNSVEIGKSWASSNKEYYIVDGKTHSGIGHFNTNGDFVVEYYNQATQQVEVKTYLKN